jgi:hypothetical protein
MALRKSCGRWPRGTRGVIVDAFENDATVEILDEEGRTLDVLTLGYDLIALFETAPQGQLPLDT